MRVLSLNGVVTRVFRPHICGRGLCMCVCVGGGGGGGGGGGACFMNACALVCVREHPRSLIV